MKKIQSLVSGLETRCRAEGTPLRFLHLADAHLGASYRRAPNGEENRIEGFRAFRAALDFAQEQKVDFVLLAGDIFEAFKLKNSDRNGFIDRVKALSCPVLYVAGNHDPLGADLFSDLLELPSNFFVFPSTWTALRFPHLRTTVWGASFQNVLQEESLLPEGGVADWLDCLGSEAQEAGGDLHLGLLHGQTLTGNGSGERIPYHGLPEERIAQTGLHYLALGHVHRRTECQQAGKVYWAYPGSLRGNGFDETGAHGAYLVSLRETGEKVEPRLDFIPFAQREFRIWTDEGAWKESLVETGRQLLQQLREENPDLQKHYYRIICTGRRPQPLAWRVEDLEEELRPSFYSVQVENRTIPSHNLYALAEENTLRGLMVRQALEALRASEGEEETRHLQESLDLVLQVFEGEIDDKGGRR